MYQSQKKPELKDLYFENRNEVDDDMEGPSLLESEILEGLKSMKNGMAESCDGIPGKLKEYGRRNH